MQLEFMKFFYVHPNDARWLRRWLANNIVCVLAIVCFLVTIRLATSVPPATIKRASADRSAVMQGDLPPETDRVLPNSRERNPVAPEGWRRTDQGWEHVSTWPPIPRPLFEIIQSQQDREPAWIQLLLAKLRNVPPLIFALIQVTAIAVIVNARGSKQNSPERFAKGD